MAGNVGRNAKLLKDGTPLIGIRNFSMDWAGEPVDLTSGEDDGIRLLANDVGQESIDISFDGVTKDDLLVGLALGSGSKMLTDITIELAITVVGNTTPGTISGNFFLNAVGNAMPYNDGVTFSGTLQSSGAWVYTPESA